MFATDDLLVVETRVTPASVARSDVRGPSTRDRTAVDQVALLIFAVSRGFAVRSSSIRNVLLDMAVAKHFEKMSNGQTNK